jgi:hypothetical protein
MASIAPFQSSGINFTPLAMLGHPNYQNRVDVSPGRMRYYFSLEMLTRDLDLNITKPEEYNDSILKLADNINSLFFDFNAENGNTFYFVFNENSNQLSNRKTKIERCIRSFTPNYPRYFVINGGSHGGSVCLTNGPIIVDSTDLLDRFFSGERIVHPVRCKEHSNFFEQGFICSWVKSHRDPPLCPCCLNDPELKPYIITEEEIRMIDIVGKKLINMSNSFEEVNNSVKEIREELESNYWLRTLLNCCCYTERIKNIFNKLFSEDEYESQYALLEE